VHTFISEQHVSAIWREKSDVTPRGMTPIALLIRGTPVRLRDPGSRVCACPSDTRKAVSRRPQTKIVKLILFMESASRFFVLAFSQLDRTLAVRPSTHGIGPVSVTFPHGSGG